MPSPSIGMAHKPSAKVEPSGQPDVMGGVSDGPVQPPELRCCCGREDCVFLRHNCSILLSVERDVHTAAKMGQVCLVVTFLCSQLPLSALVVALCARCFL